MKSISIKATSETPEIKFDAGAGFLEIKGRSIAPNPLEFYKPLNDCIEQYVASPAAVTKVDFYIEYFNTGSSRCLLSLLRQLVEIHQKGSSVEVTWNYEDGDENIRDAGIDYQSILNLPFTIKEIPAE